MRKIIIAGPEKFVAGEAIDDDGDQEEDGYYVFVDSCFHNK